jgi:hypothetical protein
MRVTHAMSAWSVLCAHGAAAATARAARVRAAAACAAAAGARGNAAHFSLANSFGAACGQSMRVVTTAAQRNATAQP